MGTAEVIVLQDTDKPEEELVQDHKKEWEPPKIQTGPLFEAGGISCAKQPGNPGCNPGPFTS
jgi:hypothetical protein